MSGDKLPIVLVLLGLFLLATPYIPQLATIIYPAKFWYSLYPDGTSNNPTMLTPGSTIQLKCQLVYYDAQTGIELRGTYVTWIVQVSIAETGETITLKDEVVAPVEGRYATFLFKGTWNVPSTEGQTYTFNWLVILRDDNKVEYGRQTTTTYARTIAEEPDGYFTINGEKADEQTTHLVLNPTISVAFIPTKNADKITRVYVDVYKGTSKITTFDLVKSGTKYAKTYTLPGYGTYTFKGFYTWTGSDTPIQKMSVVIGWEEGKLPTSIPYLQIAGLLCIATGVIFKLRRR